MKPVRSRRNKIVVDAARLHRVRVRRERDQTLIEGPNLLEEAVRAGVTVDTVFALEDDDRSCAVAEAHGLRLTLVDRDALSLLADTETPRGPVSIISIPDPSLHHDRDVLVSWGVSDPGNVGTLIRTAAAFGWDYAYTPGSADPWSPKALRAGAGGQFQTSVVPIEGPEALKEWHVVATAVDGGTEPVRPPDGRVAVVIGEEAAGLPVEVQDRADILVTIPTPGPTESLNAAAAAAVLVYELSKGAEQGSGKV